MKRSKNSDNNAKCRFLKSPLAHLFVAVVLVALCQGFVAKLYAVPTGSMQRTIEIGDRIVVNKMAFGAVSGDAPTTGDVVVFKKDASQWDSSDKNVSEKSKVKEAIKFVFGDLLGIGPTRNELLVKRVIATEGSEVGCCSSESGQLTLDDQPLSEPYIYHDFDYAEDQFDCSSSPRSPRCLPTITVPRGKILVMGDHRKISDDGSTLCRSENGVGPSGCYRWVDRKDIVGRASFRIWPLSSWGPIE